jgi:undecaprenyl-diphosphatase
MTLLQAIFLGIVQGLTEFLPVSSSGHLVLIQRFMAVQESGICFEVMVHFGSLIAVLAYFFKDLVSMASSLVHLRDAAPQHKANHRILLFIIVTTIVTGGIYALLSDAVDAAFESPLFAAMMLAVTGAILFTSDMVKGKTIPAEKMGFGRSVIIGLGQSLALLPGISRSGTTIATSVFTGLDRRAAARFSFLISIPAILGAVVTKLPELAALSKLTVINYAAGALAAFISGYMVIAWLINLVAKNKLKYFAYYCWMLSVVSIIVIAV